MYSYRLQHKDSYMKIDQDSLQATAGVLYMFNMPNR